MKVLLLLVVIGIVKCEPQRSQSRPQIEDKNAATGQTDTRLLGGLLNGILGGGQGGGFVGGSIPGGNLGGGFQGGIGGGFPGIGGGGFGGSSSNCRYWCKNQAGQFYCCEGDNQRPGPVGIKRGQCPPVRLQCPPTRSFGGPKSCSNDGSCPGVEKCCFDKCLEQHVCKRPTSFGGGGFGGGGFGGGGFGGGFGNQGNFGQHGGHHGHGSHGGFRGNVRGGSRRRSRNNRRNN